MSHMVIYRGADGKPGYHQTDDIHDAVNFVETMRNSEGVEHARIFRLEEIVFQYRPYYRVELTDANGALIAEDQTAALPATGSMVDEMPASDDGHRVDVVNGSSQTNDYALDVSDPVGAQNGFTPHDVPEVPSSMSESMSMADSVAADYGDTAADYVDSAEEVASGAERKGLFGR